MMTSTSLDRGEVVIVLVELGLVELGLVEQRYQAVLEVVNNAWAVSSAGLPRSTTSRPGGRRRDALAACSASRSAPDCPRITLGCGRSTRRRSLRRQGAALVSVAAWHGSTTFFFGYLTLSFELN